MFVSRRSGPFVALLLALSLALTGCGGSKASTTSTSPGGGSTSSSSSAPQTTTSTAASADSGATCPTSNAKGFAKSRFVLHTGEAFGAFHRYLYKPLKAGSFSAGSSGRAKTFIKAGVAVLFIKRQIRLASEDVKANPTLCKAIAAPLSNLGDSISGAVSKLQTGDISGIEQANSSISSIASSSSKNGVTVKENENANLNS